MIRLDNGPEFVSKVRDLWAFTAWSDAGLQPPGQADGSA